MVLAVVLVASAVAVVAASADVPTAATTTTTDSIPKQQRRVDTHQRINSSSDAVLPYRVQLPCVHAAKRTAQSAGARHRQIAALIASDRRRQPTRCPRPVGPRHSGARRPVSRPPARRIRPHGAWRYYAARNYRRRMQFVSFS